MSNHEIWKIRDKEWVKSRRKRWKGIQKQLINIARYLGYYKKEFRFHKAYFLKGILLPYDQKWLDTSKYNDPNKLGQPFELNPAFKIWYYPEVDESLFEKWGREAGNQEILSFLSIANKQNISIKTEYEFFSDRSIYLDRYLVPKTVKAINALNKYSNYRPENILSDIFNSMRVCVTASNVDCHKGRFQLAFAFELFTDCLNLSDLNSTRYSNHTYKDDLLTLMYQTLYLEQEYVYLDTGLPQRLKKELPEFFDAGVNPEVDELWEKVKTKEIIPEWAK